MSLLSFFRRPVIQRSTIIRAYGVTPGCDLVVYADSPATHQDSIALLNTVQAQFPGVRIHLLCGFGHGHVERNDRRQDCEAATNEGNPKLTIQQQRDYAVANGAKPGAQGNVVLLTHCSGGRVIAVSVPPKQQGNAVKEGVFHGADSGIRQPKRKAVA